MTRQTSKLSTLLVQRMSQPGRYADGGGLYLQVSQVSGKVTKSWLFRFMQKGKAREMGLGSVTLVTLAEARAKALEHRKSLLNEVDPIEVREKAREQHRIEAAKRVTFDYCAAAYIDSHRAGWKNTKHADQWKNTIATYVSPIMGHLPVQAIDTALVTRVLEPIWKTKTETASRVRSRIELILGWATARKHRTGENPARWRGHLDKLLPKPSKVQQVEHHSALPLNELGAFMEQLRTNDGVASRALEFLILTATRTGETLGARWDEIDLDRATWTIPAERMKAKKEHKVPLSPTAIQILKTQRDANKGEYVFTTGNGDKPLSNMAMLAVLRRMKTGVTSHGFRSTFRDWAAERTNYPREVAEMALAHTIGDKVEAAYRRGDLFEKRKRLMTEWAKFCSRQSVGTKNVVGIHAQA